MSTVNFDELHYYVGPENDPDLFIEQNYFIYNWSESNFRYEIAWWLYCGYDANSPLVKNLREKRCPPGITPPLPWPSKIAIQDGTGIPSTIRIKEVKKEKPLIDKLDFSKHLKL